MANEALDDVNAAELQFGKDFNEHFRGTEDGDTGLIDVLTNDEMLYVMENGRKADLEQGALPSDIFKKTFEYLERVATTNVAGDLYEIAERIPGLLKELELERKDNRSKTNLHPFERASLSNLISAQDTTPAEVVRWIPSLHRFDDDEIQKAIDIIVNAKTNIAESLI